jgi:chitodextrinase
VTVTWTASTDNIAVTGYTISRNGAPIGTATSPTYTDTTVAGGTAYTYEVAAYDAANNKSAAGSASVTTPQAADTQPPTMPTNLSAVSASQSQINLTWKASTDNNGVANYDVYRSSTGGQIGKIATVTSTSYGDTGLTANTSYTYYVVAKDGANNASQQSTTASATTQAVPTPPSDGGGNTGGNGGNNNGGSDGQIPGDIRGKVTGRNGRAVSGAHVVIVVNGKRYQSTTNRNGIYRFYNLPVGRYDMRVFASDYESRTISIRIRNDNLTITNVQLRRQ